MPTYIRYVLRILLAYVMCHDILPNEGLKENCDRLKSLGVLEFIKANSTDHRV